VLFLAAVFISSRAGDATLTPEAIRLLGATAWMALWWVSEVVPIAATSMLPLALFPLFGIGSMKAAAASYMHPLVVLLMAGFMVALALERWELHRRLALRVLAAVGTSPRRLILGMMIACALCSMWISNTATTLVMLPIGMALVARAREREPDRGPEVAAFATALFLGLAYAANVGGLGTPIGTPPNLVMLGIYEKASPDADPITFLDWMMMACPLVIVFVPAIWLYLTRVAHPVADALDMGSGDLVSEERAAMGPMNRDALTTALIFALVALLWITRAIKVGDGTVMGWAPALGVAADVNDATVAVFGALLLFSWPAKTRPGERLLDWETARALPWAVLLLFGGGFALAGAFKSTGLSVWIAGGLETLAGLPVLAMVAIIALGVTFLTEVTSNTATTTILMPILAAFAVGTGIAPELVMIPAVLSASCAFMLPVATAPNAIVFGTGTIPMKAMARAGLAVNLGGAVLITAWVMALY
jgi:sodium-dependent dicarboxylate transporter 2/3/5